MFLIALTAIPVSASERNESWLTEEAERKWGVMIFGGQMKDATFGETLDPFYDSESIDIWFSGVAVNRQFASWRFLDFELEGGAGYQWGSDSENDTAQVWLALYARYDDFPWNRWIKTTVAANIGVNYSFQETQHEKDKDPDLGSENLLHYLSPEITFANPRYDSVEAVFRLHHRSPVRGAFGCRSCGSNMVTAGVRMHF